MVTLLGAATSLRSRDARRCAPLGPLRARGMLVFATGGGGAIAQMRSPRGEEMTAYRPDPDPWLRGIGGACPPVVDGDRDRVRARGSAAGRLGARLDGSGMVVAGALGGIPEHGVGLEHLSEAGRGELVGLLVGAVLSASVGVELAQPLPVGAGQLANLRVR
jgi:hypothetical protein